MNELDNAGTVVSVADDVYTTTGQPARGVTNFTTNTITIDRDQFEGEASAELRTFYHEATHISDAAQGRQSATPEDDTRRRTQAAARANGWGSDSPPMTMPEQIYSSQKFVNISPTVAIVFESADIMGECLIP